MSQDGRGHQGTTTTTTTKPWTASSSSGSGAENNGGSQAAFPARQGYKGKGVAAEEGGSGSSGGANMDVAAGGHNEHQVHIWTERERRKKMRCLFADLHALLPHLPPKADKSTIVDEAVSYIKILEGTLQKLKQDRTRAACRPTAVRASTPAVEPTSAAPATAVAAPAPAQAPPPAASVAAVTPSAPVFQTWSAPNIVLSVVGRSSHISVCAPRRVGVLTAVLVVLEKHRIEVVSVQVSSDEHRNMFMIQAQMNGGSDETTLEEKYKMAVSEILLWLTN